MAKTRDNYQVQGNTLPDLILGLNLLLQRIADRMDKIEGIRGTPEMFASLDMNMNQITELDASAITTDAVRRAELPDQGTSSADSPTFVDLTLTDDALIQGDLTVQGVFSFTSGTLTGDISTTGYYKYTDPAGTVLHAMATT